MLSKEELQNMKPDDALNRLKEGNLRFVNGTYQDRDLAQEVSGTSAGQNPFAFVHGCIDSRTPAEKIFDQGIGDVFHGRIAGNVLDGDTLGGMEYACAVVGTPLILIMGHTSCGAVKGACDNVEMGNLTGLLKKIQPSVNAVKEKMDPTELAFPDMVSRENVKQMVSEVTDRSEVLKGLVDEGKVAVHGAIYDVKSGRVEFL